MTGLLLAVVLLAGAGPLWEAGGLGLRVEQHAPTDDSIQFKTCTHIAFGDGFEVISDLGNNRFVYRREGESAWQISPVPVKGHHSAVYHPGQGLWYVNDTDNHRMIAFRDLASPDIAAETAALAGIPLDRPHDVVLDPESGWLYAINPNNAVVFRFKALGEEESALDLSAHLTYSRGLTWHEGRLYVVGSAVGKVVEVTDFESGAYTVHLGAGKKAEAPAGNWDRTGLVPNDAAFFNGHWYVTSFFTPAAPYSEPGENADTHKLIRFRTWTDFESGNWEDLSALLPQGITPYYMTVHNGALYLAGFFSDGNGADAVFRITPSG
jgi:hypothetical protein